MNKPLILMTMLCSLFALFSYREEYKQDVTKKTRFQLILACTVALILINSFLLISHG